MYRQAHRQLARVLLASLLVVAALVAALALPTPKAEADFLIPVIPPFQSFCAYECEDGTTGGVLCYEAPIRCALYAYDKCGGFEATRKSKCIFLIPP